MKLRQKKYQTKKENKKISKEKVLFNMKNNLRLMFVITEQENTHHKVGCAKKGCNINVITRERVCRWKKLQ